MSVLVDSQKLLIQGRSKSDIYEASRTLNIDAFVFRIVVGLTFWAYLAVYSTGFLRSLLAAIAVPLVFFLFRGRAIAGTLIEKVAQVLSLVTLFFVFYQRAGPVPGIVLLIEFTSIILLLQIMLLRTVRAIYGALILSLMIILAVAAMNVNFLFPLILLPYVLSFFLVLRWMSFFRHQSFARHKSPPESSFKSIKSQLAGFIVSSAVFAFMWLALFYIIPRTESIGLASEASKRRLKGFSDTLSLGESGLLEDNPAVVMRVRPIEEKTVSPSIIRRLRSRTLRGTSFAVYRKGQWEKGRKRRWFADLRRNTGEIMLIDDISLHRDVHPFEIILESTEPPLVFVPDQTTELSIGMSFIGVEDDRTLFFINRVSGSRRYTASIIMNPIEVRDSLVTDILPDRLIDPYTSSAGIPERVVGLAGLLASGTQTIAERVNRATSFLQRQCVYSLDQAEAGDIDPLEFFLFENKAGSCEHFATALALLLRAMQIPARPVSGYTMGDWNDVGKFFTVRQGHAHTWVEVFFPLSGWVPFDPTPVAVDYGFESELAKFFLSLWETYEGYWFSFVYSFDNRSQVLGFRKIFAAMGERLNFFQDLVFRKEYLMLILLVVFFFGRRLKFIIRNFVRSSTWIPLWYIEWEAHLPVNRKPSETPAEFHARLLLEGLISSEDAARLKIVSAMVNESAFNAASDQNACQTRAVELLKEVKVK